MGFIQKTFDSRKFARAMRKLPGEKESRPDHGVLTPKDLNPCLLPVYVEILREEMITISNLDFDEIGEGDIDDLESVLVSFPANRLFGICEVFAGFEPSAAAVAGVFI